MKAPQTGPDPREGMTLIEVLVVVGIVGVLATLTFAAVQHVRGAARQAQCANRLRQLAQANLNYQAAHRVFPAATYFVRTSQRTGLDVPPGNPAEFYATDQSGMVDLLPHLGEDALHDRIDPLAYGILQEVATTVVPAFRCPADPRPLGDGGNCNYRMNGGSDLTVFVPRKPRSGPKADGPFRLGRCVAPAEVTGGLSKTAGFAEKLLGDGDPERFDPRRDALWLSARYPGPQRDRDEQLDACRRLDPATSPWGHQSSHGESWISYGLGHTIYNHVLPPQPTDPQCLQGPVPYVWTGAVPASSLHSGGVNVATLDGAVALVSPAVDLTVWRATGSVEAD